MATGELVVASDIRTTLFRRALLLLDDVNAGLEDFGSLGSLHGTGLSAEDQQQQLVVVPVPGRGQELEGVLSPYSGSDVLERVLATVVQGRTNTARRAVGTVTQIHNEIDSILSTFEREFPAAPAGDSRSRDWNVGTGLEDAAEGQPSEEVLRVAAATTAAAARFRVRAAEAAKQALQLYDAAAKQAAAAARATTQALELQASAEQHSASGNLAQALEDIRQANRLRDESVEAARNSRQLQQEYLRQRREAQEAHAQADAAMRHAYSLERGALTATMEAATRDHEQMRERYDGLARQAEGLQEQATTWDSEADGAVMRAEQAQQEADAQMAAGNYELGNALMEEAVRAQEQAGYARQQAAAARDASQRLVPDVRTARERLDAAEQQLQDVSQRQAQLQEATAKQRMDRLQEEADGLAALCSTAESATALHEELVQVYEDRLAQDQQHYEQLLSEGKTTEAGALAVHISTWHELLDVARQNRDTSRTEAASMRTRLQELSTQALMGDAPTAATQEEGPAEDFEELRGAVDRSARASQAARLLLSRDVGGASSPDPSFESAGTANDGLLLQTDLHRQRIARLAHQLHVERRRLAGADAGVYGEGQPATEQAEALLDSMAVSHLVGTLEATRLLQLWKQRSEQAAASADELRTTWSGMEQAASAHADEAVRLEEQALRLHDAGHAEEAAATMAQADELHRMAEKLRLEADRAKAVLYTREKAASEAQSQQRMLVQGLHDVEHAAERLQTKLGQRGFDVGPSASAITAPAHGSEVRERPLASQEETATVMMASPSMLSRASSIAALGATVGRNTLSYAVMEANRPPQTGYEERQPLAAPSATSAAGDAASLWATSTGPQHFGGSDGDGPFDPFADTEAFASVRSLLPSGRNSAVDNSQEQVEDEQLAPLIQELKLHAAVMMPDLPSSRWDGQDALNAALEVPVADESALATAAGSASALQSDAHEGAELVEVQQHRDQNRLIRWQDLAAALPAGVAANVAGVVDRTAARCSHAIAASTLLVEALTLQADCHGTLGGSLGGYRCALASLRVAEQASQSARAEAMVVQEQAQDSLGMDAQLLAQVQQLEAALTGFEAEGSAAQALTARYELQRLQNKHMDAAAQAGQLHAAYEAARQRADQARRKEAEAFASVQTLNSVVGLQTKAAAEADGGVQYALDAYGTALSALALGAKENLALLASGVTAGVSDAEVQRRMEQLAGSTANSHRCMDTARKLQEAAGVEFAAEPGRVAAAAEQVTSDLPGLGGPSLAAGGTMAGGSSEGHGESCAFTADGVLPRSRLAESSQPSTTGLPGGMFQEPAADSGGYSSSALLASSDPALHNLQPVMGVEAELASLHRRHQQELERLTSGRPGDGAAAEEEERQAVQRELHAQLREAERQLEAVRHQQASLRDASPAEVQASHDLMQSHEEHVAMLRHALLACDQLVAARATLQGTRGEVKAAELQVKCCDEAHALLAKAAELCSVAAGEVEAALHGARDQAEADQLSQRLAAVQDKAADIEAQQAQTQHDGHVARGRRRQLSEQLAGEELAVRLREEWLQQASKAAAAATTMMAWDKRLIKARTELQQLEAPMDAQRSKAKTSASQAQAQAMAAEAAQQRKKAGELIRQAAKQRDEARQMANNSQKLEADAAKTMAESLQQQADGLLAQVAQAEEDARKLRQEAQELEQATGRAHGLAAAKAEVLQQVAAAHRLSVTALQLRRTAAGKLADASQKHAQASQQQAALSDVEEELSAVEAQMAGSLRPSELATHMINVARGKQHASSLRTSLRAVQQQVERDREAAAAAAREAAKIEDQLAQMDPRIQLLEQQAAAAAEQHGGLGSALALALAGSASDRGLQHTITFGRDAVPHGSLVHASVALSGGGAGAGGGAGSGAGFQNAVRPIASIGSLARESSSLLRHNSSGMPASGSYSALEENFVPRLDLGSGSDDEASRCRSGPSLVGLPAGRNAQLQRSGSARQFDSNPTRFSLGGPQQGGGPAANEEGPISPRERGSSSPPGLHRSLSGFAATRDLPPPPQQGSNVLNVPLARLRRGAQGQPSLLGIASGGAPGTSGVQLTPQGSPSVPLSRTPSRRALARDGVLLELQSEEPRSQQSFTSTMQNPRGLVKLPEIPQHQPQHHLGSATSFSIMSPMGSPRAPENDDGQAAGTAGALFEKVAGRSLRPLSYVRVTVPAGAQGQRQKTGSRAVTGGGAGGRNNSADGGYGGGGDSSSSGGDEDDDGGSGDDRRVSKASVGMGMDEHEEEEQDEDGEAEPDTKMYRTIKQRLEELEVRVLGLRRQGDTANTAAEILGRKQEQLRMDMTESRDADEAQRAALLDHGDAMVRLKEAEGALCHKQADMLEDEAASCHDALHYATVDWRLRREVHRLEQRCGGLTSRAQAMAMEAQGFEADAADAAECSTLATARLGRQTGSRAYSATLEQQRLSNFIEEQQRRLQTVKRRAADSRAGAARLATIARDAFARRQLFEKKSLCNKALYQSAVELADAYDQTAKVAAQEQHYRLVALKAAADGIGARGQQLDAGREGSSTPGYAGSPAATPSRARNSLLVASRSHQAPPEVFDHMASLADAAADCIQQYLEEVTSGGSEAVSVLRKRMDAIAGLMTLYQDSFDSEDYLAGPHGVPPKAMTAAGGAGGPGGDGEGGEGQPQELLQPLSDVARRAARIVAAEAAVHGLDRACGLAADLRAMCVEAAAVQGALCDARSEPSSIHAQLLGHKDAGLSVDQEEVAAQQQRLATLNVQLPLSRDQLSGALQAVEYGQAAAQLAEARQDLQHAAAAAQTAAKGLEATVEVRREALDMLQRHMASVLQEAHVFRASGNLLQATAAEEAARLIAENSLTAEGALAALVLESQLKLEEQAMALAAAEELRHVAEGSTELAALLLRVVDQQQEARAVSGRVEELSAEYQRLEDGVKSEQRLAEATAKQAELLQHESLQCRMDLKFATADTHLAEARHCRSRAQEHAAAASSAKLAVAAVSRQLQAAVQHREQLLREVRLLHAAAGHLQEALTCMRDKHHLVRKLRDVEHRRQHGEHGQQRHQQTGSGKGKVAEADVLRTQLAASSSTIQHHVASKASYLAAANHLHLAMTSLHRSTECASQADAAMRELLRARLATATTGAGATVPLLSVAGRGSDGAAGGSNRVSLHASPRKDAEPHATSSSSASASPGPGMHSAGWQLQQAELRHRCLRGSISALEAVAAAAERACDARRRQVHLSDQAAGLVSDLAAKILEAEANADEAAGLEASVRVAGGDEEDEEALKTKLMVNALLQKAETYRGEATALQGRIRQLEQEERAADATAAELEAGLESLQVDHRHTLEALDLTARIGACREQEAALRSAARAQAVEVTQLDREATGHESKAVQLRQQLTNASHSASPEDVANLMMVTQTMGAKAAAHRALQQQRKRELEGQEAECERMAGDIALMAQRAEHVLRASETQEQVRQVAARLEQLRADLTAAQSARGDCGDLLEELREHFTRLSAAMGATEAGTELLTSAGVGGGSTQRVASSITTARQTHETATTQAAIVLAEQMLQTHTQRVEVMQAAVGAWESARQRQEAVLRHQEQLVQQAEWRTRMARLQSDLQASAVSHLDQARQLRESAGKGNRASSTIGSVGASTTGDAQKAERSEVEHAGSLDVLTVVRAQAGAVRMATEAAHQHSLAEAQEALAERASALAEDVAQQADRLAASTQLVHPMTERLSLASNTAVSVARLQLVCVGVCCDQGGELTTMHGGLEAVRTLAAKIQSLLEAGERHMRAGQGVEAAVARGQAAALQDALQAELRVVQASRQQLLELEAKLREAKHDLGRAESRLSQVLRPAAVAQSVAEYVHQACGLFFACAERQPGALRLVCLAAEALGRSEVARRETKASKEAAQQLAQAGKGEGAMVVERAAASLEHSFTEAQAEHRLLTAQAEQEADACIVDTAAAELYGDLALLSVRLLQHMDQQEEHAEEHEQLEASLMGFQRSLHSSRGALTQRREEMGALGAQIETHRGESLLQRKRGNDAQSCVRQDAADELTMQLAEVADEVMQLDRRCAALDQRQGVLSSLCAKAEARVGMLSQMARLCSAGVGHLLDARDAHDSHGACVRDAASAGVALSQDESALAAAETRVRELQDSAAELQRQHQQLVAAAGDDLHLHPDDDDHDEDRPDPEEVLRAAGLARAGLLIARRRRTQLEQQVLTLRSQLAAAEVAVEISQLRINKARQRGEDVQRLVNAILSLLDDTRALVIDSQALRATLGSAAAAATVADAASAATVDGGAASNQHGMLAAAQLHSVTLQAVAEVASKFVEALDVAAAAEQARSAALLSAQAAQAARQATERQRAVIRKLREAALGAGVAQQVQRLQLHGGGGDDGHGGGDSHRGGDGRFLGGHDTEPWSAGELHEAFGGAAGPGGDPAQAATAAGEVELERLQHEAAYLDAIAAQEHKLAACLEQQQGLLRRTADSLLDMARYGIAAELNASPRMSAHEAASLLAACKQLSQQHAATLTLAPPLEAYKQAEACLRASLDCMQEARRTREAALARRLAALKSSAPAPMTVRPGTARDSAAGMGDGGHGSLAYDGSTLSPRRFGETLVFGTAPAALSRRGFGGTTAAAPLYPTAGEKAAAETAVLLAQHDDLLAEEERLLQQVQQLDDAAVELREEAAAQSSAFGKRWAEASQPTLGLEASQWLVRATQECEAVAVVSSVSYRAVALHSAAAAVAATPVWWAGAAGGTWGETAVRSSGQQGDEADSGAGSRTFHDTQDAGMPPAETDQLLGELTRKMLLQQQEQLRDQYQPRHWHRTAEEEEDGPAWGGQRQEEHGGGRGSGGGGDIDPDLVAMAAAAVARAKAAAASLAAREHPGATTGRLVLLESLQSPQSRRSPARTLAPTAAIAAPSSVPVYSLPARSEVSHSPQPTSVSPIATALSAAPGPLAGPQASLGALLPAPVAAGTPSPQRGNCITDLARTPSASDFGSGFGRHMEERTASQARAVAPSAAPTQAMMPAALAPGPAWSPDPAESIAADPSSPGWERQGLRAGNTSSPTSASGSIQAPPSSAVTDFTAHSSSASQRRAGPHHSTRRDESVAGAADPLPFLLPASRPDTHGTPLHTRPALGAQAAPRATAEAGAWRPLRASIADTVRPGTPALVRLPLPDDLHPVAADGLQQLWASAALHYRRAQHMHDGAIVQLEQQWERCQAQLQVLQAEELQARSVGGLAEAEAVASAAAQWRQRAAHLHAAMQRHGAEVSRHKALARRAIAMGERLGLLSAAAGGMAAGTDSGLEAAVAVSELVRQGLVPRLPGSVLAGSAMVHGVERVHAELVQQVAALQAAAGGLQLQSQRTFAKASGRSSKLKSRLGATQSAAAAHAAHAASLAKNHAYAEQATLLGERAVEQAAQSRELAALAERLSTESTALSQTADRLQRAAEQELAAQQALVQAADLLLCEAMQAALFGAGLTGALAADGAAAPAGDLDGLLATGYAAGVCVAAAAAQARRGEDLAQQAARAVQAAKEQLEARQGQFVRVMQEVAAALSTQAVVRTAQRESLLAQGEAAAQCVARAGAKVASRRGVGDVAAADKYAHAAEGWAKQAEKLRRQAMAAAAAAEELVGRAQAVVSLGGRVSPVQAALDSYLDEQLHAWAAAALHKVHSGGRG